MSSWNRIVCEGCWRRCRYGDFKPFVGYKQRKHFEAVQHAFRKETDDPSQWRYKRRRTVLGYMHGCKLEEWKRATENCPHLGEVGPLRPFRQRDLERQMRESLNGWSPRGRNAHATGRICDESSKTLIEVQAACTYVDGRYQPEYSATWRVNLEEGSRYGSRLRVVARAVTADLNSYWRKQK